MSKSAELDSAEAFAFLSIVAPKLEQLRRRFVVANRHLESGDPDEGRINAIVESQLAIKEFMTSLADLSQLVEPIDIVLEAVREEPPARVDEPLEAAPDPEPAAAASKPAPTTAMPPTHAQSDQQRAADTWLQIGTAIAVDRLTNAGMSSNNAEFHLEEVYATLGLVQADGNPITKAVIKDWRTKHGPRRSSWRNASPRRKGSVGKGGSTLIDVKSSVGELATTFSRMARLERRG